MVTAYIMDIPQSSHDTASIIDLVRKLYTKSATFVSHIKFVVLALVILPIIFIIGFTFSCVLLVGIKLSKYRLKRSLKKDLELSLSNYKRAKEIQNSLQQDLITIQKTIDLLSEKSVFMSSVLINDIKDTHKVLSDYQQKLNDSLSNLSKTNIDSKYLVPVTEQTLWNNRVEAYQYRL
jgi:hypothetical protein